MVGRTGVTVNSEQGNLQPCFLRLCRELASVTPSFTTWVLFSVAEQRKTGNGGCCMGIQQMSSLCLVLGKPLDVQRTCDTMSHDIRGLTCCKRVCRGVVRGSYIVEPVNKSKKLPINLNTEPGSLRIVRWGDLYMFTLLGCA